MRRTAARPTTGAIALSVGLVVALCSGCSPDAGTQMENRFAKHYRDEPDVTSLDTYGDNTLPFLGSATGILTVAPDTPDERVHELYADLVGYSKIHSEVSTILQVGDFSLETRAADEDNDAVLDLWHALRDDPDVVSATLETGHDAQVVLASATNLADFTEDLCTPGGELEPVADTTPEVRTLDDKFSLEVCAVEMDRARDAYRAVNEKYPITYANIEGSGFKITIPHAADVEDATQLAVDAGLRPSFVEIEGKDSQTS